MNGEADKVMNEADRLMSARPSSFLGFLTGGGTPDYHEAAEKYSVAGNLYKASSQWAAAGDAYLKASAACLKEGIPEEAARKQLAAAACLRKAPGRAEESITLYEQANEAYIRAGRFAMVGNNEKECADICEKELGDKRRAADFYAKAAERYLAENSPASAAGCKQKEAALSAEIGEYERAVDIYEQAAKSDSMDTTRRYNTKEHLFRAGLIRLAMNDLIGTKKQLDTYLSIDNAFGGTREFKLLEALCQALEDQDVDAFAAAVEEFERINRLDDWKVSLLYKAKHLIEEEPSLA